MIIVITRQEINGKATLNYSWYDVNELNESDIRQLKRLFRLTPAILNYISDRHERPHYDYDVHTQSELIVYDVPIWPNKEVEHFTTRPIIFLLQGTTVFTFHNDETAYVFEKFKADRIKEVSTATEFIMTFLLHATNYFNQALDKINNERNILDRKLNGHIINHDLLQLAQIEKSLIYLSSSIKTNLMMLEDLRHTPLTLQITKESQEKLDDILIEMEQASRVVQIANDVTGKISRTSNNILNNNLNDTMKFLTGWSIILTIPTIGTGFYGMNVDLPFMKLPLAWLLVSGILVSLMLILYWFLKRKNIL
ncbi:magnesium and cobalt transport protein cora [Ligilactobacillus equi DSM 15833 = JCM 10991]|nr:magnesium and cobalt transport protein cora [Ligilactobacillus equi DSM 15833 = JCM 10991]